MLKLMLITNDPVLAVDAYEAGVDRIFVDLERLGKLERQGHLDTLISQHAICDVATIRRAVPQAEILVRLNPLNAQTPREVDEAVANGADTLMLPMFDQPEQVMEFSCYVRGRVGIVPLVETALATTNLESVVDTPGIVEVYFGLNDLHLSLGLDFMFEPLANGMVDRMAAAARAANRRFGFGGIARIGEGALPAELVLGEHVRLGSSSVILSRTFCRGSGERDGLAGAEDFRREIAKLREWETLLSRRTEEQVLVDSGRLVLEVERIAQRKRRGGLAGEEIA